MITSATKYMHSYFFQIFTCDELEVALNKPNVCRKRAYLENILMRFSYSRPLALCCLKSLPTKSLVGLATFYRKTLVSQYILITRATLHCLPSRAATTHLRQQRLVSYIYSIARCYRVSNFSMDASANAGHDLISFIAASPTRENTF